MRLITAIALCLALALFVACGGDDDDSGNGGGGDDDDDATSTPSGPSVRGEVVTFEPFLEGESDGGMRVDGELEEDTAYDRAVATFNEDTDVFRREGDSDVEASVDDLALGQFVEVTFTGPVAESDPVIGTASKIVILADEAPEPAPAGETTVPAETEPSAEETPEG